MPAWTALYVSLFFPLVCLNFGAALKWGGRYEIEAASGFLAATVAERILEAVTPEAFSGFVTLVAIIDLSLFIALATMAIQSQKKWLLLAAALQLLALFGHFARLLDDAMTPLAYAILMGSGGYPSQTLLLIGIVSRSASRIGARSQSAPDAK
ncbi:hypothetical protein [Sphingomonas sp. HMP6]|uniref:hypothetical protein n=1 Tax=Sphingomonas sp. HMP6 TaxID=1517551 RepID=UPI0015967D68|nr:hypothetical protein [Sphingomonas sp. HMP6]BCA59126.1 hypothetical protein HMP06_1895 [Sphingomonas sp. HMP6]